MNSLLNSSLSGSLAVFISKRFLSEQDLQPARSPRHWSVHHPHPLHTSARRPKGPCLPFQLGEMVKLSSDCAVTWSVELGFRERGNCN